MTHNNPALDLDVIKKADTTLLDEHSWAILTRGESNTNIAYEFPYVDGHYARMALDEAGLSIDSVILVNNEERGIVLVSRERLQESVKDIVTLYHDSLVKKFAVREFSLQMVSNDKDYGLANVVVPFVAEDFYTRDAPVGYPDEGIIRWGYDLAIAVMEHLGLTIKEDEIPYYVEFLDEVYEIAFGGLREEIQTMIESGVINDENIAQKIADNLMTIPSTCNSNNPPVESFDIFKDLDIEDRRRLIFLLENDEYDIVKPFTDSLHSIISHINNSLPLSVIYIPELLNRVISIENREEGGIEDVIVEDMSTDSYCAYENFRVAEKVENSCRYAIAELNRGKDVLTDLQAIHLSELIYAYAERAGYSQMEILGLTNTISNKGKIGAKYLPFVIEALEDRIQEEKANILTAKNDRGLEAIIASQIIAMEKALPIYRAELGEDKNSVKDKIITDMREALNNGVLLEFLGERVTAIDRNDNGYPTFIQIASYDDINVTVEYEVGSGYFWYTRASQINGEEALASSFLYDDDIGETVCHTVDFMFCDTENRIAYESRNLFLLHLSKNQYVPEEIKSTAIKLFNAEYDSIEAEALAGFMDRLDGWVVDEVAGIALSSSPFEPTITLSQMGEVKDKCTDVLSGIMLSGDADHQFTLSFTQTDECVEARMGAGDISVVVARLNGIDGVEYLQNELSEESIDDIENRNDKEAVIQVMDRNAIRKALRKAENKNAHKGVSNTHGN